MMSRLERKTQSRNCKQGKERSRFLKKAAPVPVKPARAQVNKVFLLLFVHKK
jgi:hypothetical protein